MAADTTLLSFERADPPPELVVMKLRQQGRRKGQESPVFTPVVELDLVWGEASSRQLDATSVVCPSQRLTSKRTGWARNHLGDGVWRRVEAVKAGPPGSCIDFRFSAAAPFAVIRGKHAVRAVHVKPSEEKVEVPRYWDASSHRVLELADHPGKLVHVAIHNRWEKLYMRGNAVSQVSHPIRRAPDGTNPGGSAVVPLVLCVDTTLMMLQWRCAPGESECVGSLMPLDVCEADGS